MTTSATRMCLGLWLALAVAAAFAALPSSAAATNECTFLADCTSVPGPWVVVPAGTRATPFTSGATVLCPSGDSDQLAIGSDYQLSGGGPLQPFINRFLPGPGAGLITGADAHFFAVNFDSPAAAFRPLVGCVQTSGPQARDAAAGLQRGSRHAVRTREVRLRPSRRAKHIHRCRQGERLVNGVPGILFHTRRPPSAREMRDVTVTRRITRRGVQVSASTGPSVGDDERVTLQILAVCRR